MSNFPVLKLPSFSDARGALSVIEDVLPFPMKRIYWVYGADGKTRGGHRHRQTRQALIAVHGDVVIHMDDGLHVEDIRLDSPDKCLLVEPKDWHTMSFGSDAVLLVIVSHPFDRNEYIDEGYSK